jgi:hypothetical protein
MDEVMVGRSQFVVDARGATVRVKGHVELHRLEVDTVSAVLLSGDGETGGIIFLSKSEGKKGMHVAAVSNFFLIFVVRNE